MNEKNDGIYRQKKKNPIPAILKQLRQVNFFVALTLVILIVGLGFVNSVLFECVSIKDTKNRVLEQMNATQTGVEIEEVLPFDATFYEKQWVCDLRTNTDPAYCLTYAEKYVVKQEILDQLIAQIPTTEQLQNQTGQGVVTG